MSATLSCPNFRDARQYLEYDAEDITCIGTVRLEALARSSNQI